VRAAFVADGDDRRLVQNDALVAGENQGVGGAKVDGEVGGEVPTESSEHSKSSQARHALRPAIAGMFNQGEGVDFCTMTALQGIAAKPR
jgi:hypothetical protein